MLSSMLMTAADVAAIAKPWELQHETAKQVADEFFDQGDMERMQLGINPMWMMDRERKDELPQMQVRETLFIVFVGILDVYGLIDCFSFPEIEYVLKPYIVSIFVAFKNTYIFFENTF